MKLSTWPDWVFFLLKYFRRAGIERDQECAPIAIWGRGCYGRRYMQNDDDDDDDEYFKWKLNFDFQLFLLTYPPKISFSFPVDFSDWPIMKLKPKTDSASYLSAFDCTLSSLYSRWKLRSSFSNPREIMSSTLPSSLLSNTSKQI